MSIVVRGAIVVGLAMLCLVARSHALMGPLLLAFMAALYIPLADE